jgi:16S rRNA C967 or C1407 C5-methylase (RsmB/RsmF family)/NOL1/NOP2/fmu family ribosome biogenesis protein
MNHPNLPESFIKRMEKQLDKENFQSFLSHYREDAPVSIRLNPAKAIKSEGLEQVPWAKHGYYLPERPVFTLDPLFHAGAYYVQEASSMFVEEAFRQVMANAEGIKVLDLSAAPGGKSTLLASLLDNSSLLVANEVIRARVGILEENLSKWGHPNIIITNNDPSDFSAIENYFDLILVDAPCSGEGMFRKDPEACNQWSEENVQLCAGRQERILADIIPALKPGGILIYSTCTFSKEENEENIKLLVEEEGFTSIRLQLKEEWNITESVETTNEGAAYSYRFYPNKVKGEGFFLACLKKEGGREGIFKRKVREDKQKMLPQKLRPVVSKWVEESKQFEFLVHAEEVYALPKTIVHEFFYLDMHLKVKYSGVKIGRLSGENLIPSHELALSLIVNENHVPSAELSKEEAIAYLRKEDIKPETNGLQGWALVKYEGLNLGWVKILKNRINNYFPMGLRIRMKG